MATALAGPAAAAEIPAGARIVARFEQEIAIRTIAIQTTIAPMQANAEARMARP